jgi:hypothetical protein
VHAPLTFERPLCVGLDGFTLHAATRAGALDAEGREALIKYILRPAIAEERVTRAPEGLVRIALKKPFSDGTVAIDLDPLSLLARLCASVPPPRFHTVRYAGVLASASKVRARILPAPKDPPKDAPAEEPRRAGFRYRPWAELLKRTFGLDVLACPRCLGRLRLVAMVKGPKSIARFLRGLGEPSGAPARTAARGPSVLANSRAPQDVGRARRAGRGPRVRRGGAYRACNAREYVLVREALGPARDDGEAVVATLRGSDVMLVVGAPESIGVGTQWRRRWGPMVGMVAIARMQRLLRLGAVGAAAQSGILGNTAVQLLVGGDGRTAAVDEGTGSHRCPRASHVDRVSRGSGGRTCSSIRRSHPSGDCIPAASPRNRWSRSSTRCRLGSSGSGCTRRCRSRCRS